jgi:hypothetical protein
MNWTEWLLDVSFEPPCFVPYERDTGRIVLGMNLITDRCPGKLIGLMHSGGQEAVEQWEANNPDWQTEFGKAA